MGKIGLYLKIGILGLVLVGVFYAMRGLTPETMQSVFEALGIEPGASGQPGLQPGGAALAEGETRRTLCKTRIAAVRFPDGRAVVELKKGLKLDWVAEETASAENEGTPAGRSLNYLAIEKWFSLHCQFVVGPAPAAGTESLEPSNEPQPLVKIEFIDGTHWGLSRAGATIFSDSDPADRFRSQDLEQALVELRSIAGFPVDTSDR